MAEKGPWLLAAALDLIAENVRDDETVARLLQAAEGSRAALRGAYARALALAGELPADETAKRAVDLLTRAMRLAVAPLRVVQREMEHDLAPPRAPAASPRRRVAATNGDATRPRR